MEGSLDSHNIPWNTPWIPWSYYTQLPPWSLAKSRKKAHGSHRQTGSFWWLWIDPSPFSTIKRDELRGFLHWGYPHSWMVYKFIIEHPNQKWMMTGGTPMMNWPIHFLNHPQQLHTQPVVSQVELLQETEALKDFRRDFWGRDPKNGWSWKNLRTSDSETCFPLFAWTHHFQNRRFKLTLPRLLAYAAINHFLPCNWRACPESWTPDKSCWIWSIFFDHDRWKPQQEDTNTSMTLKETQVSLWSSEETQVFEVPIRLQSSQSPKRKLSMGSPSTAAPSGWNSAALRWVRCGWVLSLHLQSAAEPQWSSPTVAIC